MFSICCNVYFCLRGLANEPTMFLVPDFDSLQILPYEPKVIVFAYTKTFLRPQGALLYLLNSCTLSGRRRRRRHEFWISGSFGVVYIGNKPLFLSVTSKNGVFGVYLERFFPGLWNFWIFWSFFSRGKNDWPIKTFRNHNFFWWIFFIFCKK